MTDTDNNSFDLADWRVSPHEGLVTRGDEVVHLEPLAMEVLVYLANHAGEVVSRELLEKEVWRGAVVSYDAVTNTIIKLRKALQDDARQPSYIATIPKKGYQLIADIAWQEGTTADNQVQHSPPEPKPSDNKRPVRLRVSGWVLATFVGMGLVVVAWYGLGEKKPAPKLPSIVVLPFANLNDDPRQAYLANGITEDITTDLSRMSNIRVLAGNTALNFEDRKMSVEQLGEELEVKFVLKGSVRQLGGELRVNAQLVDTDTGFNVWAERYDRKVSEVFAVQDDVTRNIVHALALNLTSQEKQRLARQSTANLQAYDYFQEGQRLYKISTQQTNQQSYEMYRKAIDLDPAYGRAYGAMAVVLAINYRRNWTDNPVETLDRALQLAKKAVSLDDSTPQTWWALGFVHMQLKNYEQAEQAALQSIEVAPNYADGYGLLAIINSYHGKPERAIAYNDKAIALNPYYSYEYLITYGLAYYTQGEYAKAIEVLEKAYARNPNHITIKLLLSASYIRVGRQKDAEWVALELQLLNPPVTISNTANTIPMGRGDIKQGFLADLKSAGLPD